MKSAMILGTRGSQLALWQARLVAAELEQALPGLKVEIKIIRTTGDKILDVALSRIGDKGLFTKEIENELLQSSIDIAVHSLKDLPTEIPVGLCMGAVLEREDPRDVLISYKNYRFSDLPPDALLGTSSLRRVAQIRARRPDIKFSDIRGNVETRIKKMQTTGLDGIILALAGVKRLGFSDMISDFLPFDLILPAAGQGSIAVEARKDDKTTLELLRLINHEDSSLAIQSERAFLSELQGGCQVPIGCLGTINGDEIMLEGMVASLDGKQLLRKSLKGQRNQAEQIGQELGRQLLNAGADKVLAELRNCTN